jgi:hypothetical protein
MRFQTPIGFPPFPSDRMGIGANVPYCFGDDDDAALWIDATGVVRLADGTEYPALLNLCMSDSGEHYGTWVHLDAVGWVELSPDVLGRSREQVFPYRYRYHFAGLFPDHHVGADGWSR